MPTTEQKVKLALELVDRIDENQPEEPSGNDFLRTVTPDSIVEACAPYVVGQDDALRAIAEYACLWLRWHFAIADGAPRADLPAMKALTVAGTTASGKTYICRKVCKYLGMRFVELDASSLTGEGWRGQSLGSYLRDIAHEQETNEGVLTAVFVDEFDKNANKGAHSGGYDASFDPTSNFLSVLDSDGTYTSFTRDSSSDTPFTLNTDNCMWVFAGAFTGIGVRCVRKRLMSKAESAFGLLADSTIGKVAAMDEDELRALLRPEDLVAYGMMSEWAGRAGHLVNIPTLSKENLVAIVKGSEHSMEARFALLFSEPVRFSIEDAAAEALADRAAESALGARVLECGIMPLVAASLAQVREGVAAVSIAADGDVASLRATLADRNGEVMREVRR